MDTNVIYCGDCQQVMINHIKDDFVDLIYIDPPFYTSKPYELFWNDGYERRAFEDRWKGGIQNYIAWMEGKLKECHRVLKKTGSIYLHCDWHANAYLRVKMDEIFGENNFKNEIIWQRTFSHNDPKRYGNISDHILFYTKSNKWTWNNQYLPYTEDYIKNFFKKEHKKRTQRKVLLTAPGIRHGFSGKPWKNYNPTDIGRHWGVPRRLFAELKIPIGSTPQQALETMEKAGRIKWSTGGIPEYIEYLDEMKGTPLQNIWTDISPIQHKSIERMGYPTQKPEALLERIIKASSNEGDIILDPMCGCGTAIAVAQRIERQWMGIDVSPTACKLMVRRMKKAGAKIGENDIVGLPKTIAQIKVMQPFEFQNWVCQQMMARISKTKSGDMGIDGWIMGAIPLQVKQSESIGRNVIDNFETAMKRVKKTSGVIVALSFGKGAYEEVARAKNEDKIEIELKTVEDIMGEA